jgi:hypothetical protein
VSDSASGEAVSASAAVWILGIGWFSC